MAIGRLGGEFPYLRGQPVGKQSGTRHLVAVENVRCIPKYEAHASVGSVAESKPLECEARCTWSDALLVWAGRLMQLTGRSATPDYYRARQTENDRGCTIAGRQGQTYNLTLAATAIALDGDQCLRPWAGGLWNNDSLADKTTLPMLIDKRVPQRSSGLARTQPTACVGGLRAYHIGQAVISSVYLCVSTKAEESAAFPELSRGAS